MREMGKFVQCLTPAALFEKMPPAVAAHARELDTDIQGTTACSSPQPRATSVPVDSAPRQLARPFAAATGEAAQTARRRSRLRGPQSGKAPPAAPGCCRLEGYHGQPASRLEWLFAAIDLRGQIDLPEPASPLTG